MVKAQEKYASGGKGGENSYLFFFIFLIKQQNLYFQINSCGGDDESGNDL